MGFPHIVHQYHHRILQDVAATVAVVKGTVLAREDKCLHFPLFPLPSLVTSVRPTVIFPSHFFDGASAQILSLSLRL